MTKPSKWAKEIADNVEIIFFRPRDLATVDTEATSQIIALAIDAARRKALEEAAKRVIGINDNITGKPVSVLIRALIDREPTP